MLWLVIWVSVLKLCGVVYKGYIMKITENFTLADLTKTHPREVDKLAALEAALTEPNLAALQKISEDILEPVLGAFSGYYASVIICKCDCAAQEVEFEVAGHNTLIVARLVRDICEFDILVLKYFNQADPMSGRVCVTLSDTPRQIVVTDDGDCAAVGLPE